MEVKDVVIAVLSLFDVVSGAVLAVSYGFLLMPSALGYLVGVIGAFLSGSVTPVSFMYESMVLSWGMSKVFKERIGMILFAAALTGFMGVFGLPEIIVNSIGNEIFLGMLAGVGVYLAKVGLDISLVERFVGIPTFIVAILVQIITEDLFLTVSISVFFGIVLNIFGRKMGYLKTKFKKKSSLKNWSFIKEFRKEFKFVMPIFNKKSIVGGLALSALTIGGNIAYTAANAQISSTGATYNHSTVISAIADFVSSIFGGANMELIVTPTAAAPDAYISGIIFMVLASFVLLSGLVHKLVNIFPLSSMGGYLFAIGGLVILPYNAVDAYGAGNPIVVSITLSITAISNPFWGILAGCCAKFFTVWM